MPYIGKSPSGTGVRTRFLYTATASQTTFSGADTQNLTLSYSDSNFIDVHQNGVLLKIVDDYTATSGTSVVLGIGATADDVIEITVYDIFSVANHVKKSGDNMTGPLTITTEDNLSVLTLTSTDADASQGPTLDLFRNSASPATNDTTGKITFTNQNDAGESVTYGFIDSQIATVTDGSEQGRVRIITRTAGNLINRLNIEGNETVINDGSANVDFRVESNNDQNMIFVDGSEDKVGIGTSSPSEILHLDSGGATTTIQIDSDTESSITFNDHGGSAKQYKIGTNITDNNGQFEIRDVTAGVSRMRINSDGTINIGTTSGSTINSSSFGIFFNSDGQIKAARNIGATSNAHRFFGNAGQCDIKGDGDIENTNGRISSVSDERFKENIVDASSQWNDIKKVKVRNYNFKEEKGWGTHKQIGVVAQELETSGMTGGLVKTNDDGYKSVATSILYMKAVKALQEAMARIETLEAKVTALESK